MQGMFSEEHQWGDISKSSPIGRKKGYRNTLSNSSSACQDTGAQKNASSPQPPSATSHQLQPETAGTGDCLGEWTILSMSHHVCSVPDLLWWCGGPSPPWSRAEGLSTTPSCAWQWAGGSWSPHSAKEPLLKYLPHSDACSSSFPGCLWMGQFAAPPPLAAFEHPLTFASETDIESLRPEAYCGPQE